MTNMTTDMMVKVCGITRREDAQVAGDAGASAIGFVFYPKSPRYIQPERAAVIGANLKVWKVGIFVDLPPQEVMDIMNIAKLDIAQIYGGRPPQGARTWRAIRMPLPPADGAQGNDRIDAAGCEAVLLDGPSNGVSFDWNSAASVGTKLIVAGGLDASNVAEAIRIARPWGVDASSKLETSPGIKDHEKVKAFVAAAVAGFKSVGKEFAC